MKKSSIFITVCGVLIIVCALTASLTAGKIFHQEPEAEISTEQARSIALQDAGVNLEDVTFTRKTLEKENDRQIYLIEFYDDEASWKYRIDGMTGSISRRDEKTVIDTSEDTGKDIFTESVKDTGSEPSTGTVKDGGSYPSAETINDGDSDIPTGTVSSNSSEGAPCAGKQSEAENAMNYIGVKKAQEIALKDAGLKAGEVTFGKSDLDHDMDKVVYEIEFKDGRMEYEYEIDAMNGSIIDKDMDKD